MAYSPTPLAGIDADRFGVKKNTGWLWLPTIADTSGFVPIESEINAGQDLTCSVQGFAGFSGSPRYAELPDLCADVDPKVPDGVSLDDSSITFYLASSFTSDALDFFTEEDEGFVAHAPYGRFTDGSAALTPGWVWKVQVSFVTPTPATAGGAMGTVSFGVLARRKVTFPVETT